MMGPERLEVLVGRVLRVGTVASTTLFAVGLSMAVLSYQTAAARLMLNAGLIILLATPVARVVVSTIEYIRQRDWIFAVLTLVVLSALGGSLVAAYL